MLEKPEDFVHDINFNDLSLQEFARKSLRDEKEESYEGGQITISIQSVEECEYVDPHKTGL